MNSKKRKRNETSKENEQLTSKTDSKTVMNTPTFSQCILKFCIRNASESRNQVENASNASQIDPEGRISDRNASQRIDFETGSSRPDPGLHGMTWHVNKKEKGIDQ